MIKTCECVCVCVCVLVITGRKKKKNIVMAVTGFQGELEEKNLN